LLVFGCFIDVFVGRFILGYFVEDYDASNFAVQDIYCPTSRTFESQKKNQKYV